MNLRAKHLPPMFRGALLFGLIGGTVGFFLPPGSLPSLENEISIPFLGVGAGILVGVAISVTILLVKEGSRPGGELPYSFTFMRGTGSLLVGKSEVQADGSYVSTEWFVLFFMPIFPVASYRLKGLRPIRKVPLRRQHVFLGYLVSFGLLLLLSGGIYGLSRM